MDAALRRITTDELRETGDGAESGYALVRYSSRAQNEKVLMTALEPVFIYVLEGEKTIRFIDETVTVRKNEGIFIARSKSVMCQIGNADGFRSVIILLGNTIARTASGVPQGGMSPAAPRPPIPGKSSYHVCARDAYLDAEIRNLSLLKNDASIGSGDIVQSKMRHIIQYLTAKERVAGDGLESFLREAAITTTADRLLPVIATIRGLEDMADVCGMSVSSMRAYFSGVFDTTPKKWLEAKKIELAKTGLQNDDLTIAEVCFQSGFNDISTFVRSFRRNSLCTPGEYREKMRKTPVISRETPS